MHFQQVPQVNSDAPQSLRTTVLVECEDAQCSVRHTVNTKHRSKVDLSEKHHPTVLLPA